MGIWVSINISFATSSDDFTLPFLRNSTLSSRKEKKNLFNDYFKTYLKEKIPFNHQKLSSKCSRFLPMWWTIVTVPSGVLQTKRHFEYVQVESCHIRIWVRVSFSAVQCRQWQNWCCMCSQWFMIHVHMLALGMSEPTELWAISIYSIDLPLDSKIQLSCHKSSKPR